MKVVVVVCSLLLAQLATAQYEEEPDELAPYESIRTGDGYEVRMYPQTKWVCHHYDQANFSPRKQKKSFFALFRYITGSNEQDLEIPMTAPVTMLLKKESSGMKRFQMCFYLPEAHQVSPPLPTNAEVYIEDRPSMTVFTRTFGGFARRKSVWENEAKQLQNVLLKAGEANVDFSSFYSAGYNSPMKFENRRNEVWFMMKDGR
ncbi:heme-binding protein 2-like [Panulirus ornatus]|uniref:heme-binding protein 2-like n=1 Tax=Panulirus ornatus TaxID=150431 RepID=UPI003A894210